MPVLLMEIRSGCDSDVTARKTVKPKLAKYETYALQGAGVFLKALRLGSGLTRETLVEPATDQLSLAGLAVMYAFPFNYRPRPLLQTGRTKLRTLSNLVQL